MTKAHFVEDDTNARMKIEPKEYPDEAIGKLDELFPKGNKKRGEAMGIMILAFIEGKRIQNEENCRIIDNKKWILRDENRNIKINQSIRKLKGVMWDEKR